MQQISKFFCAFSLFCTTSVFSSQITTANKDTSTVPSYSSSTSSCSSSSCSSLQAKSSTTITDAEKLCDLGNMLKKEDKSLWKAALRCYEQAAKDLTSIRGRARALANIGLCYKEGTGVEVDQKVVLAYYHASAEVDKTFAWPQYKLFLCYFHGQGTQANQAKAFEYLKRAAELGHAEALSDLGAYWQKGTFGKVDMQEAVRCYRAAITHAEHSHSAGQRAAYNLALCYAQGLGVTIDARQALELYSQAAAQGLTEAIYKLAYHLLHGNGVNKNLYQAFEKYKEAALAGDSDAQLTVARAYQRGIMVKKDADKAAAWLSAYEKKTKKEHRVAAEELNAEASFFTSGILIDFAGELCPICQDETRRFTQGDEVSILSCFHVVCNDCLQRRYSTNRSCPLCRTAQQLVIGTIL
jgi:hypothetical protein